MITIENRTPFPSMAFEKTASSGEPFDVLVMRMTLRLITSGHCADLEEEQEPIVMSDSYHGDSETSSLMSETDLVIVKKQTDIHVTGHARQVNNTASPGWSAGIRVGDFSKRVWLSGPHHWFYRDARWQLSQPEPISSLPLRYEYAYGGKWQSGKKDEPGPVICEANPVGVGFYPDRKQLDTALHYPAPQITRLPPQEEQIEIDRIMTPQGMGPLSRWWQARRQYAGTYDDTWLKERHPRLPKDFDTRFYNSAHPELRYPGFLKGDELIALEGMLPDAHRIVTGLPGYQPVYVLLDSNNLAHTCMPLLDTLTIDLDERLLYATWRLAVQKSLSMRQGRLGCLVPKLKNGACYEQ